MPETARSLGLRRWPFDQRYQPEPSAPGGGALPETVAHPVRRLAARARGLQCGRGAVQGLLERNETRSFDGLPPQLPAETQMFVPKVEATILRREGVSLAKMGSPQK